MIPNTADTVEVISNITGETGQFTVDENSLAKIMSVLTNLYSDPEGAVVREYLTNALDAQIEAQEKNPNYVWRPIEVTTPSHFNKTYIVRDFGIGMSVDDLKEIYSKYGKSTKETSNAVTGMLGLGSKCALTYTGQFTIVGYKNGIRTKAIVSKDDNDIPVFMIVDTRATSEPNGVEISVPVRDRNTFAEKTRDFLRWWKEGQVLVDGKEPVKHGLVEVKPGIFLMDRVMSSYRYEAPQSYVIMGNVPYAVDAEYVDQSLRDAQMGFAAYVPMGAVDFPPSREKLFYNNRTKAAVSKISEGLFEAVLQEKLNEITNAPTHRDAWIAHNNLPRHFANHKNAQDLKYKGLTFPDRHQHNHMTLDWDWQGHGQISDRQWLTVGPPLSKGALVVTGVTQGAKPTSYFKKKVKFYIESNSLGIHDALLVDDDIDLVWLDHLPRIDADTIKNLKLPKAAPSNSGPRAESPYEFYELDATGKVIFDCQVLVPTTKTITYVSPQDLKETYRKQGTRAQEVIKRLGDGYTLVVMGSNRIEKFKRTYTNAIPLAKAMQQRIDSLVAAATDAEYIVGKLEYGERQFFENVDVSKIDDPDLVALAKIVQDKNFTTNYSKAEEIYTMSHRANAHTTLPEKKNVKVNASKRYPLIQHMGKREIKHLVIYLNAVYAQEYAPKQP